MKELMKKRTERRGQGQGGFTLIELLVVIAILAVLAGVVVFAVGGITDDSQTSACEIDERTVRTAAEAYRAERNNATYPANMAAMVPGFLSEASTMHTYTFNDGGTATDYTDDTYAIGNVTPPC